MTNTTLASASDLAVWASIAVLALAMLAFAAHLAVHASVAERRSPRPRSSTVGTDGAGTGAPDPGPAARGPAPATDGPGGVDTLVAGPQGPAPSRRWGVLGVQLTWVATFALVAGTVLRGLSVSRPPLGNMYEFALVACAFTLVVYSGWTLRRDRMWLGLFVTLPVVLILGAAKLAWYTEASQLLPSLNSAWLVIHVTVATLSVALFTIGCVLALLYLARDRAENRAGGPVTGWVSALPRAAALERITYGLHIVAFPLWTFTVIAGAIWAEQAWGRYWGWDPKEVWSFVIWVLYAAYLHARATAGWSVRRATWLAVAGFGAIIVNYAVVNIFFVGWHSYSGV